MEQPASGISLGTLLAVAGLFLTIFSALIGALWRAQATRHTIFEAHVKDRFDRLEDSLLRLFDRSVTPDMCKAHAQAVNVKIEGVGDRLAILEARA